VSGWGHGPGTEEEGDSRVKHAAWGERSEHPGIGTENKERTTHHASKRGEQIITYGSNVKNERGSSPKQHPTGGYGYRLIAP